MGVANQKLMFMGIMALVFVVATFSTDARKLDEADDVSLTPPKHLHYGMLPKGVPVPPSGPSKGSSSPSPPPHKLHYGMLPKGVPVPPSGPSKGSSSPSPPPHKLHYGMLPKGVPVPPSGPSRKTSLPPPPPPHRAGTVLNGLTRGHGPLSASNVDSFYVNDKGPVPPSGSN